MKKLFISFYLLSCSTFLFTQSAVVEGYVFESGNRGFLSDMTVMVLENDNDKVVGEATTNVEGYFSITLPDAGNYRLKVTNDLFHDGLMDINAVGEDKVFLKVEMRRAPGYVFEVTLAEERDDDEIPVDGIRNARIEVYNNTTKKTVLELLEYDKPDFRVNLKKGNHYTILIRRDGFLAKRMEAFVDVEGCILCFEGIGDVRPGVSDGLTDQNSTGILLANVELQRSFKGRKIELNNLYYDLGSARLKKAAKEELDKLIMFMGDNPNLKVELGSHTDSRGKSQFNDELSSKRAKAVVDYLLSSGSIENERLLSAGYGERQLKNECSDGVSCTEEEHAINRRTELKLVGKTMVVAVERSLASMKQDEHMDELLREIQEEGIRKVPGGEEPENADMFPEHTDPPPNTTPKETDEIVEEVVKEERPAFEEMAIEENEVIEAVEKTEVEKIEEVVEEEKPVFEDMGIEKDEMIEMVQQVEKIEEVPVLEDQDEMEAKGIRIVLLKSKSALTKDHAIFRKFEDIEEIKKGDEHLYLIGNYKTAKEAQAYIDARLFRSFPGAKVFAN